MEKGGLKVQFERLIGVEGAHNHALAAVHQLRNKGDLFAILFGGLGGQGLIWKCSRLHLFVINALELRVDKWKREVSKVYWIQPSELCQEPNKSGESLLLQYKTAV